jgi:acetolactate synthase I/II/III large subunit
MRKSKKNALDRRKFLKGAAAGAAAFAAIPAVANTQPAEVPRAGTAQPMPKEPEADTPPELEVLTANRSGSDFMVDVIKSLGFEYVSANPGSSFRGLHESLINYGGNEKPEFITCCHEESAVAMAHGYSKIEGKPMAVLLHSDVGLQHASMAIYNAFCDRVPVYLIAGNALDINSRRPGVEWDHSAQDVAAMARDFLKWDDVPISLEHFAESAVRAYKIAMMPPMAPVLLVADGELQEGPIPDDAKYHIPKLAHAMPPQGDSGSVAEAARMLVAAESPVILLERTARTADGLKHIVELAETLQAPVVDLGARMNFPTQHPLNQTERTRAVISGADVILGLEALNFWGTINSYRDQLHRTSHPIARKDVKLISITATDLYLKSNYQDFQRYTEVDLAMAADAEATLPSLIEAVKRLLNDDRKRTFADRGKKLAAKHEDALRRARDEAAYGWDASPITTARLCAEIWGAVRNEDWSLVCEVSPWVNRWPLRLWNFDKFHQYIGSSGGFGVGYGAPAALGAALANRKYGRLTVTIQNDGDLMYAPGVLWTSAHHRIPLLSVMHNNRAYHQEVMHVQRMASRHSRGIERASIGTTITDPNIDFATVAKGMGVYSEGPITDPKDLGPAIKRAVEVVKRGEPALIDAVTQPR